MIDFKKWHLVGGTLLFLVLFFVTSLVTDPPTFYVYVGSTLFFTSLAVLHAYWPSAKVTLKRPNDQLSYIDSLTMGIMLIFAAIACQAGYVTFWNVIVPVQQLRPDVFYSPLTFFRCVALIAALLHLSARRVVIGPRPLNYIPGWPRAMIAVLLGIAVAFFIVDGWNF